MSSCPIFLGCGHEKGQTNLNSITMKTKKIILSLIILSITVIGFSQKSAPVEGYFDGGINCRHAASVSCTGQKSNPPHTYLHTDENNNLVWDIYYKHFSKKELETLLNEPFTKEKSIYFYIVEDGFILDETLRRKLMLQKDFGQIPKDVYLAIVEGDILRITMPILKIEINNSSNQRD